MTGNRSEDREQTMLFMDILGFASITERSPFRVIDEEDMETGYSSSTTGPIQNQLNQFHNAIERCVRLEQRLHIMFFSDCVFLAVDHSLLAAQIAIKIMRDCNKLHIPVRMGLGRGTFYPLTFLTEYSGERPKVPALPSLGRGFRLHGTMEYIVAFSCHSIHLVSPRAPFIPEICAFI